jgi:Transglycosylase SLT domain
MCRLLAVLLVSACISIVTAGLRAEPFDASSAAGKPLADEFASSPSDGNVESSPPATDGVRAKTDERDAAGSQPQVQKTLTPEVAWTIDSICLILESAAAANGLPLEFFVRVIWEESRFRPNTVGPMTIGGDRALGIAQFMPYTASERGLLDPFDPATALPEAAEFLAELRGEFGNLGLAAAAYNAGPGRLRNFIGGRGDLPGQTRNYVRAVTGRSIEEWQALDRQGGKDGFIKSISCLQLAAALEPDFSIGDIDRRVDVAALSPDGIPQANPVAGLSTESVAARERNPLQAPAPTLRVPIPRPNPKAASKTFPNTRKAGKLSAAGLPPKSAATKPPRSSPDHLRGALPKETPQDHAAGRRLAAVAAGGVALVRDKNLRLHAGLAKPNPKSKSLQSAPVQTAHSNGTRVPVRATGSLAIVVKKNARGHGLGKPTTLAASGQSNRSSNAPAHSAHSSPTRIAAPATRKVASASDKNVQVHGRSSAIPERPNPRPRPRAAGISAAPVASEKSVARALRASFVESSSSKSKQALHPLRERSPKEITKAADERINKIMIICRGC